MQTAGSGGRAWIYFAIYAAMYGAFGAASPFWPRILETRGLTPQELGLLLGCGTLVRLVSGPLFGRLADATRSLPSVLSACMALAAAFAICLLLPHGFALLLLVYLLQAAALAPLTSLADALALRGAALLGFQYGWLRGTGSGVFVLGTLAAGWAIGQFEIVVVVWIHAALLLCGALLVLALRSANDASSEVAAGKAGGFRAIWQIAVFRRILLVAALVYGSHAVHDAFAMIRWNAAGITPWLTGVLWSEAVAAEVIMFFLVGPRLIERLGSNGAAALAAAAGILRWTVMGTTTSTIAIAAVQPLHGFTFALTHLACMQLMRSIVPQQLAATGQAAYALSGGLAGVILTMLAGPLYAAYGSLAFLPMAILCAIAVPVAWQGLREIIPARVR